ncbi:MAG TPA: hypothetical protein VM434_01685 [Beijerinckiaceae bacterium]|nr:hypothetical protein [Beijerinckiaceae bacterium]
MAHAPIPISSDRQLVVRVEDQVFVVPSDALNGFRNAALEKLGPRGLKDFFDSHAEGKAEAVLVRVSVVMNGDIAPPRTTRAKKA